jgi:hypothetical protein
MYAGAHPQKVRRVLEQGQVWFTVFQFGFSVLMFGFSVNSFGFHYGWKLLPASPSDGRF